VDSFMASDGIRLGYCIDDFTDPWKEAPVLLLLHAAMGSARRYYAWVPPLSRHYRVVRMDLRGHGSSQVPPTDRELTLERLVRDVVEHVLESMDRTDATGLDEFLQRSRISQPDIRRGKRVSDQRQREARTLRILRIQPRFVDETFERIGPG